MNSKIEITDDYKKLFMYGLPKNLLGSKPFELDDFVDTFNSSGDRLKNKRISKSKQIETFSKISKDVLYAPYLFCVSGFPTDTQAKMLAAYLMYKAFKETKAKKLTPPRWHNIYLGFDNPILKDGYRPSFLVLSNITGDTSNQKVDKLRDCLEHHCNIPRVVVCSGVDPLTFFNTRMHMSINGCVYLTGKQAKKYNEL